MNANSRFVKEPVFKEVRELLKAMFEENDSDVEECYWDSHLLSLLAELDPCKRHKHHKWLLRMMLKQPAIIPHAGNPGVQSIRDVLAEFTALKHGMPVAMRDISQYDSIEDLSSSIYAYRLNKTRITQSLLSGMVFQEVFESAPLHYEGQDIIIFKPRNIEEAEILADGANWGLDWKTDNLYGRLRDIGTPLIWYTSVGKFLSVIPRDFPFEGIVYDQDGDQEILNGFASVYQDLSLDDSNLALAIIAADPDSPFYSSWGDKSKLLSVQLNPFLLDKPEITDALESVVTEGDFAESFWATGILASHQVIKNLR